MSSLPADYETFFSELTGFSPYPYQVRIALDQWSDVVDVPTSGRARYRAGPPTGDLERTGPMESRPQAGAESPRLGSAQSPRCASGPSQGFW